MKKLLFFSLLLLLLDSCSYRLVDFTIISTKNLDLSKGASFKRGASRRTGEDKVMIILSIPTGRPNMKEAIDKAIQSERGCVALLDGVVYVKGWSAIVYGETTMIVEGTPLIDPSLAYNDNDKNYNNYTFIKLNKDGSIKSSELISEADYKKTKQKVLKDDGYKKFEIK